MIANGMGRVIRTLAVTNLAGPLPIILQQLFWKQTWELTLQIQKGTEISVMKLHVQNSKEHAKFNVLKGSGRVRGLLSILLLFELRLRGRFIFVSN